MLSRLRAIAMPALLVGAGVAVAVAQYVQVSRIDAATKRLERVLARPASTPRPAPLPKEPVALSAATLGNLEASVAIIEFSDFECPFCESFAKNVLPEIRRRYIQNGSVLLSFKHLPLERIHAHARAAAVSVECARTQGKFWEMHDALFQNPRKLDSLSIRAKARSIKVDSAAFHRCVEGPEPPAVLEGIQEAQKLSITGTPTFFIGTIERDRRIKVTTRLAGAQPLERFASALDSLLAAKR